MDGRRRRSKRRRQAAVAASGRIAPPLTVAAAAADADVADICVYAAAAAITMNLTCTLKNKAGTCNWSGCVLFTWFVSTFRPPTAPSPSLLLSQAPGQRLVACRCSLRLPALRSASWLSPPSQAAASSSQSSFSTLLLKAVSSCLFSFKYNFRPFYL
jgi:hypothetical protein